MTEPEIPDWFVQSDAPLPLEWEKDGDKWLHHLVAALGEIVDISGHGRAARFPTEDMPLPFITKSR